MQKQWGAVDYLKSLTITGAIKCDLVFTMVLIGLRLASQVYCEAGKSSGYNFQMTVKGARRRLLMFFQNCLWGDRLRIVSESVLA